MASDSDDSDADFVTYGTPLEPLEEDEPLRKPVPVHEQTVKDEKGRYKRFHGAFTGGFSAGYFNSVGTKEGWAPSTFVSSREQKAEKGRARPEDFMDEEDFSEHGIAPSEISRTEEFGSGRRDQLQEKARLISSLSATIPGDTLLKELIAPARTSIGVELLRKMGWKDGQGVGPRMKRKKGKQKTESSGNRIYGCAPPRAGSEDSEEEDEEDEEFAPENVTFAPKDVTPIDFTPKENVHGLGYSGLNPLKALLGSSGSSSASGHINLFSLDSDRTTQLFGQQGGAHRSRKGPTGQAFGVGAMEDDDEDVYHRDSMSNYDRVLGGKESGDGLYGWTAPQQYKKNKTSMSVDAAYLGKILEGFTLSSLAVEQKTVFPPPVLPSDYRPVHYFRPVFNVSGVSPALAQALQASKGQLTPDSGPQPGRHQLDSAQRGQLLGETALQGPSSIFELLSSEDRQKLASLRSTSRPPAAPSAPPSSSSHDAMASAGGDAAKRAMLSAGVEAAKLTAQRAMASRFQPQPTQQQQQEEQALSAWKAPTAQGAQTFKPFESNASKQARYDLYLSKLRQGDKDSLDLCLDTNMTEWERSRERDEFVRAAILFKPASSFLSSRFTRGKREDTVEDNIEVNRDEENDVDDKQAAVKMKMFGQLTRDTFEWHPDKLLCKRFNVPDPFPGSGLVGMPKVKRDKFSVFNFLNVSESPTATASAHTFALPTPAETSRRSRWDKEDKQKDPLSEFISVARNTASGPQPDQSTSTDPPSTTAAAPTTDIKVETKSPEHPDGEKKKTVDEEDAGGEEEEEEETRPPMDLFKAIFDSSSDDKSSSSSEEGDDDEDTGRGASEVSSLFNTVPAASTPQTETPQTQLTVLPPAGQTVPAVASSSQNIKQEEEEEFGPKLPPPSSVPAAEGTSSLTPLNKEEVKRSRRSNKEKHKNKKQHKHKKDKKKKKHKKHKHKAKQKKKETSDSSSEDSEADDQGRPTTDATTQELLKRLKTMSSQQQQW